MKNKPEKYFKDDFLRSPDFKIYKDLLTIILNDNVSYTILEVQNKIKKYYEEVV